MGSRATNLAHFRRRAIERLGMRLSNNDIAEIVTQIQDGIATHVRRRSNRRSIFLVSVRYRFFYVVYSTKHKTPITVYPIEWQLFREEHHVCT